jgi:hypothetical protein
LPGRRRVVGKRGQPDYKFFFEFAEPTEPDLLEGEEWKPWGSAYLGYPHPTGIWGGRGWVSNQGRFATRTES